MIDLPLDAAFDAGLTPDQIAALIEHWEASRPAWEAGALYHRIANARPHWAADESWPKKSEAYFRARNREVRKDAAQQRASEEQHCELQRESDARAEAHRETVFGPALDAMSDNQAAELLEQSPAVNNFYRRSLGRRRERSIARDLLLRLLEERGRPR